MSRRNPFTVFGERIEELNTQGHPFYRPTTLADVDGLSVSAACVFFRRCFSNVAEFTFIFVGNFDSDALRRLLVAYLGDLASTGGLLPVVRPPPPPPRVLIVDAASSRERPPLWSATWIVGAGGAGRSPTYRDATERPPAHASRGGTVGAANGGRPGGHQGPLRPLPPRPRTGYCFRNLAPVRHPDKAAPGGRGERKATDDAGTHDS